MTVLERIDTATLPEPFACWFASRGWEPRPHQLALLAKARAGRSVLLVAPTGAGKTLAGFLPTLVELAERDPSPLAGEGRLGRRPSGERGEWGKTSPSPGLLRSPPSPARGEGRLHTLYISPLKALAVDIARNLEM